jgi:hypothetical protein
VATLKTDGLFTNYGAISPTLAYIDMKMLALRRKSLFELSRNRRTSTPVLSILQKKLRTIQPQVEANDPFLGAVLIALAQERRRCKELSSAVEKVGSASPACHAETGGTPPEHSRIRVHLLALSAQHKDSLYLYTASIPYAFLDRFDMPSRSFPGDVVTFSNFPVPLNRRRDLSRALNFLLAEIRNEKL